MEPPPLSLGTAQPVHSRSALTLNVTPPLASGSAEQLAIELASVRSENAALRFQLANLEAQLGALRTPHLGPKAAGVAWGLAAASAAAASVLAPERRLSSGAISPVGHLSPTLTSFALAPKTSRLMSGLEVPLGPDELAALKATYDLFGAERVHTRDVVRLYQAGAFTGDQRASTVLTHPPTTHTRNSTHTRTHTHSH